MLRTQWGLLGSPGFKGREGVEANNTAKQGAKGESVNESGQNRTKAPARPAGGRGLRGRAVPGGLRRLRRLRVYHRGP